SKAAVRGSARTSPNARSAVSAGAKNDAPSNRALTIHGARALVVTTETVAELTLLRRIFRRTGRIETNHVVELFVVQMPGTVGPHRDHVREASADDHVVHPVAIARVDRRPRRLVESRNAEVELGVSRAQLLYRVGSEERARFVDQVHCRPGEN